MFLAVGFILTVILSARITNGQHKTYQMIDMAGAIPYDQIPCPKTCTTPLSLGLHVLSALFGSFLERIPFPTKVCQQCVLEGLYDFTFTHKCFMNQEKNVFDHHLNMKFPHYIVECDCKFRNNASAAAEEINAGKAVVGQCGKEKFKNTLVYEPIKCEGSQNGEGESNVKLTGNLTNSKISMILRVDTRPSRIDAFPLYASVTTMTNAPITHEAPPEFDQTWNCFSTHDRMFFLHLFGKAVTVFFECLEPEDGPTIVHTLLTFFGRC